MDLPHGVRRFVRHDGKLYQRAVDEAVLLLKSGTSLVPVDSGRLKRSFRRKGSRGRSRIHSPVKYASFVEKGIPQPLTRNAVKLTLSIGVPVILGKLGSQVSYSRAGARKIARTAQRQRTAQVAAAAKELRARLREIEAKGLAARPRLPSDEGRSRRPTGRVRHLLAKPRWTEADVNEVLEILR